MSRSGRDKQSATGLIGAVIVAALGVAMYWAMFYSAGYGSGYNERKAQIEAKHYASDTANQIERECGAKAGKPARECITDIVNAERESERGESDLAAQWKAADWVMWAGILAGAQLIATALGLYFVKRTLDATLEAVEDTSNATKAMERQNEIASDTAKRQLRAYCSLLEYEGTGVALDNEPQFTFTVANTGQTPAKLRVDSACWITTVGQINYSADVWFFDELTVGAGKTIKPIAKLGNKISKTEWDGLVEGTLVLCAGVYGEYTDIFGDPQSFKSIGYATGLTGQFSLRGAPGGQYST